MMVVVKLLTYSVEDRLPLFLLSNSLPVKAERLEPAGFSFHAAALRFLGFDEKDDDAEVSDKKERSASASSDSYFFKGKKKSASGAEQQDHYALLGLSHLRYLATEDQIRKHYREAALRHHPDKQAAALLLEETEEAKETKKEEIDQHFKAIQEAYEVLVDPVKRRVYDSIDEFDDGVPSECSSEDFFEVFGPVFLRNGRWSVLLPVPPLGEDDTPMAEVDKFYDFWYSFKSWREFPHADEFDLEQAESREHKRWMERQNLKLREKAKKEESSRLRSLVENAYRKDPRIIRRKEEEKMEKLRKKQARVQARKEKEEEAARVLEEERARKEEEVKRLAEEMAVQKKLKEKEKKLLRKERARLRTVTTGLIIDKHLRISEDNIDDLCSSLELEQLKCLCENIERKLIHEQAMIIQRYIAELNCSRNAMKNASKTENVEGKDEGIAFNISVHAMPNGINQAMIPFKQKICVENDSANLFNAEGKKESAWTEAEVELLRKAVIKYPKGTSQRWEVVANYIGTGRSVDEILRGVKTVLLKKPDSSKAFDSFLLKRKTPNTIESPLTTRDDEIVKKLGEIAIDRAVGANESTENDRCGNKNAKIAQNRREDAVSDKKEEEQTSQANGALSGLSTSNGVFEQDAWSEVQKLALVKAIKAFPKDTAQRWERIAAAVPGKTKAQCFKKFAALRENFRNKKGEE